MCFSLKMSKNHWKIVFIVLVALLFLKTILETTLIILTNKTTNVELKKSILPDDPAYLKGDKKFRILLWTKWYQFKWMDILDRHPKCKYTNCVFSDDRTILSSYDAILFHWYNTNPNDLPQQVIDGQKWVLYNMESPHYTNFDFGMALKKVDWIMSYRTDSDIFSPYGKVLKCQSNWKQKYSFENKTKSIAWFVSNCKTPSKRENYVKKLRQYIDVDIYGGCGPFKCQKYNNSCNQMIEKKYKFYLSFENAICKDYVTEKAFHNIKYELIPVVLGGANYSAILPPNSYIDALNFTSPKHLAEYLQRVGSDKSLYHSYFEWKHNYCIEIVSHNRNLCQLCKQLNNNFKSNNGQNKERRKEWWINKANCRTIRFKNDTIQLAKA